MKTHTKHQKIHIKASDLIKVGLTILILNVRCCCCCYEWIIVVSVIVNKNYYKSISHNIAFFMMIAIIK